MKTRVDKNIGHKYVAVIKKYRFIFLVMAVGILLMLIPEGTHKAASGNKSTEDDSSFSLVRTQEQMAQILSEIDGVGQVSVMLTASSGTETVYVTDHDISYNGTAENPEDYSLTDSTVLLNRGSGCQDALQAGSVYPEYLGAVIACDGGGDASVRFTVTQAVSSLTGLGADHITVTKRIKTGG